MKQFEVSLGVRSYPIYIGSGLLGDGELLRKHIAGQQVLVVTNETIAPLYLNQVTTHLSDLKCSTLVLPDGEQYKNLDSLNLIFDQLLADRHNRTTTLVALGGGVIGDMTGFAAACYQRGVKFIQIPTTLLAQVDSSVGGKTAVNHPLGKNMIGAFYQPQAVIIDTDTLRTLPDRELKAGYAEVFKYGLIRDKSFYDWLAEHAHEVLALEPEALTYAIERSCQIKADVVAADETEQGVRAILNLGHTFGHAIETHQGYTELLHGEAVAIGMVLALDMSQRLGWLSKDAAGQARDLIAQSGLSVDVPEDMTADDFLQHMAVDKKVLDGKLRLVLLKAIGEAVVTQDFATEVLQETLAAAIDSKE